jgi:NAD(P)-dependent dehydrogenase (short-subunit alcohol dehydrogenase family)
MSHHAFILGGTGQIGRAVAAEFPATGWNVTLAHRCPSTASGAGAVSAPCKLSTKPVRLHD